MVEISLIQQLVTILKSEEKRVLGPKIILGPFQYEKIVFLRDKVS